MALLNLLIQVIGICVAVYLMFTRGFAVGLALGAIIAIGHSLFTKFADFLMLTHQKRMPEEQLHELALRARFGGGASDIPSAWKVIATTCGVAYFLIAASAIWFFLMN